MSEPYELIKQQANKIGELERELARYKEEVKAAENNYTLALGDITSLKNCITQADMKIRTALSWAGLFPGGMKDLDCSVQGIIDQYNKLKR